MIKWIIIFLLMYCSNAKGETTLIKEKIENNCFTEREDWESEAADKVGTLVRTYIEQGGAELTIRWEKNLPSVYINSAWTKYWNLEIDEIFRIDFKKIVPAKYRGKNILREGDIIYKINDCEIKDMMKFGYGTESHWPYYKEGFIPLTYFVLLYNTEHSKKIVKEIEIERNGKRMKLKNK